ncbi:MAG: glycosyltransferase family 4 protein [Proteobacteria bacterium]|nr:glycosyltransferase family 4 protein [Pseudomonadota bacterium]
MKIAIVHDWLETYAGGERVLEQMIALYPSADLFSLVDFVAPKDRHFLQGKTPKTSFIQWLPSARKYFRHYLMLMPWAVETLDVREYDLILSSSHCVAKGLRVLPHQLHVCYIHTPVRYAWDLREEYLAETGNNKGVKGWLIRFFLERLRRWDKRVSGRVQHYIANSAFVAKRVKDFYGREAEVVYPPVAVDDFPLFKGKRGGYYLATSRQVPYKKIHQIAEAFKQMPERQLMIVGNGPEHGRIAEIAKGCANIKLVTKAPFAELKGYMQKARALVFNAKEDFGIMPVEAMACGTPVIAYGQGGATESIVGIGRKSGKMAPTGVFYPAQNPQEIIKAMRLFEKHEKEITSQACRARAEQFSVMIFRDKYREEVEKQIDAFLLQKNQ